jgi:hypothetical protein
MDVLFVRWFKRDNTPSGFTAKRLQRLELFEDESPDAFGFIDPECVIRVVHIIPGFAYGRSRRLVEPTIARREEDPDWNFYYVNMYAHFLLRIYQLLTISILFRFVDRDMFMRFRGGAVGHKAMRGWDDILQQDGHVIEDLDGEVEEDIEMDDEDSSDEELDEEDIEGDESEDSDETDEDEEESDEDWIIADYGEVLDDDILADEGYGAL